MDELNIVKDNIDLASLLNNTREFFNKYNSLVKLCSDLVKDHKRLEEDFSEFKNNSCKLPIIDTNLAIMELVKLVQDLTNEGIHHDENNNYILTFDTLYEHPIEIEVELKEIIPKFSFVKDFNEESEISNLWYTISINELNFLFTERKIYADFDIDPSVFDIENYEYSNGVLSATLNLYNNCF